VKSRRRLIPRNAKAYGVNRARPLRLRAAKTRRPALVRMRARNPWVFFRRRLFG
jgi:hypothetical protein